MQSDSIIPNAWTIPQKFRDRLGQKVGRQRAMVHDGHLLLVLHAPPEPGQDERGGRFFWRKPDGSWTSDLFGDGRDAVTKHLDEFGTQIDRLEDCERRATSAAEYFAVLEPLTPLHRAVRNLHAVLQDARELCPEAREIIDFRDRAYEIERTSELLLSEAKRSLDFVMAKQAELQSRTAEQMAVAAHRLNLLAAFFFPLLTLCAILGMDVPAGLQGVPQPYVSAGVIAIGLMLGAILMRFLRSPTADRQ